MLSLSGLSIKGSATLNGPKCPSECARLSELFLLPRSVHLGFGGRRPRSNTEKPRSSSSSNKSRVLPKGGRRRAGWGGVEGPLHCGTLHSVMSRGVRMYYSCCLVFALTLNERALLQVAAQQPKADLSHSNAHARHVMKLARALNRTPPGWREGGGERAGREEGSHPLFGRRHAIVLR